MKDSERLALLEEATDYGHQTWSVELHNMLAIIPNAHTIKEDNDAKSPVCLVPPGGGSIGRERFISNAILIAAAPEMYAALQSCLADVMHELDFRAGRLNREDIEHYNRRLVKLKAILAKARPEVKLLEKEVA